MTASKDRFILGMLPVISILAEIVKSFFEESKVMALKNYLCLALVLYLTIRYFKYCIKVNLSIYLLGLYLLVCLIFQNGNLETFNTWIAVFESKWLFPLGFILVFNLDQLKPINKGVLLTGLLFAIFLLIFLAFNIGENQYGGVGGFTVGSFKFTRIYTGSYVIMCLPLLFLTVSGKWMKKLIPVLGLIIFIILVMSTRRTSILLVIIGMAVFALSFLRLLPSYLPKVIVFLCLVAVCFPLYKDILLDQLNKRSHVFIEQKGFDLESETRYEETLAVWNERLRHYDLKVIFFGNHLFDSIGNYDQGVHRERPLHLDINVILHGSGLIGLVIFIFFFAEVLVLFLKIGFQPETTTDRIIWSTFLTFYLAMLFLIFSGGMTTVTHNMIGSIILGATLGLMSSQRKLTDNQNNPKILKPFSFDWPKRAT